MNLCELLMIWNITYYSQSKIFSCHVIKVYKIFQVLWWWFDVRGEEGRYLFRVTLSLHSLLLPTYHTWSCGSCGTLAGDPGPCYWGWHGLTLCNEWETVHVINTKNLSHFYTSTFFIGLHSKWQLGNIKELDLRYYRCCHKTIDPLIMHLSLIPEYN